MDVLIRKARPDDAEAIVRILNPIIAMGKYTIFDAPLTAEAERRYIAELPARAILNVAEAPSDGRIMGFQTMEPFVTYTRACDHVGVIATYVDLNCRRQGVGRKLFEATFDCARRKGYEKIFTYVRADNPAALAAYRRQGFRRIGTAFRHARVNGRYVDEILIERQLTARDGHVE